MRKSNSTRERDRERAAYHSLILELQIIENLDRNSILFFYDGVIQEQLDKLLEIEDLDSEVLDLVNKIQELIKE